MPCCSLHDGPSRGNIIGRTCSKQQLMKSAMAVLALKLVYRCGYVRCATVPQDSTDMLALINFRQAITGDPRGFFNSWNNSVDFCNWNGITCCKTHPGRIRELHVIDQSLEGRISPSLRNLTLLKILDLSSNNLFGQLPDLNRLRKLQFVVFSNNKLQHFAPNALTNCSNLLYLDLSAYNLTGSIPPGISFLYKLEFLNLQSNHFTGLIPSSLGNITQLEYLYLDDNQLEGSIPTELGQLAKLFQLSLGKNKLSGSIPTTILNHSSLSFLDVNTNSLRMALPSTIGNTLPNLQALGLNNNEFYGQIPASLGKPTNLSIIQLQSNYFTSPVPSSLGNLSYLTTLIPKQASSK